MSIPDLSYLPETLLWSPTLKLGFYDVERHNEGNLSKPYDKEYFEKYLSYKETDVAKRLNEARIQLVESFLCPNSRVLDVGIGNGHFLEGIKKSSMNFEVFGTDINPHALEWIEVNDFSWKGEVVHAKTFWDCLEHIPELNSVLFDIPSNGLLFVSCPIYESMNHVLHSKHFRPDEHCWYWTHEGLITHLSHLGFSFVYSDDRETSIGRDSIRSYVFKKAS